MKVMLLEIDARLKEIILAKLSEAGMLAMNIHKKRGDAGSSLFNSFERQDGTESGEGNWLEIEVFAEAEAFGRIMKSIVRLARDGFLVQFPVKVMSVRSAL